MASLRFNGIGLTLQLYNDRMELIGQWSANNRAAQHGATMRFIPNGRYAVMTKTHPKKHGKALDSAWEGRGKDKHHILQDSKNGSYGKYGIIVLEPIKINGKTHHGVGVHAGRDNTGRQNHVTHGCIRTTEEAMEYLTNYMKNDPTNFIVVQNNFDHNPTGRAPTHNENHHHSHAHKIGDGH